jgi:hypothetical protein
MTEQLVLHHPYDRLTAFDVSEHGNHGRLVGDVFAASGAFTGSLEFPSGGGSGRVGVPPSSDFAGMRSVRARARFQPASQVAGGRQNLVEGDDSFALFHEGFSLHITIFDRDGGWRDWFQTSDIPLFLPGQWYEVEFHHDGISRVSLWLNGNLLVERFDVPGPLVDVGAGGITIGRDLEGWVDDVKIWTDDPEDDVRRFVEECCLDRGALDQLLHHARDDGWDGDAWTGLVQEMLDLGAEVAAAARAGDEDTTAAISRLTRDGMLAVTHKDANAFASVFGRARALLTDQLSEAEILDFGNRALDQVRRSPLGPRLFPGERFDVEAARRLAGVLCLDGLIPPGPGRAPHDPDRPPRPDGDPRTDFPVGTQPADWNQGVNPDDVA